MYSESHVITIGSSFLCMVEEMGNSPSHLCCDKLRLVNVMFEAKSFTTTGLLGDRDCRKREGAN